MKQDGSICEVEASTCCLLTQLKSLPFSSASSLYLPKDARHWSHLICCIPHITAL